MGMRRSAHWVSTFPPMNPSCEPVELFKKDIDVGEAIGT
jgi:hypothetical protein